MMEIDKIYFFTASILKWKPILQFPETKQIIVDSLTFLANDQSMKIMAFVIMPNHIHFVWKPLSSNLQLRFMKFTAQKLKFWLEDHQVQDLETLRVGKSDRRFQIWQRNPLAIELYSPNIIEQKIDYIHNNPCQGKWMLSNDPILYEYSSASFYEENDKTFPFLTHYKDFI